MGGDLGPEGASAWDIGPHGPTPGSSPGEARRARGARPGPAVYISSRNSSSGAHRGLDRYSPESPSLIQIESSGSKRRDRRDPTDAGRDLRSSPALNCPRGNEARGVSLKIPLNVAGGRGQERVQGFPWGNSSPNTPAPARTRPSGAAAPARPLPLPKVTRDLHLGVSPWAFGYRLPGLKRDPGRVQDSRAGQKKT